MNICIKFFESFTFSFSIVHILQLKMKIVITGTTEGLSTTASVFSFSLCGSFYFETNICIIIPFNVCILFNQKPFTEKRLGGGTMDVYYCPCLSMRLQDIPKTSQLRAFTMHEKGLGQTLCSFNDQRAKGALIQSKLLYYKYVTVL